MTDNNQEIQKGYSLKVDANGMLESILAEEKDGFGRWLYKREPKGMELPLTDDVFGEMVETFFLNGGIRTVDGLYTILRAHDEHYAKLTKKLYKQYLKKYVFKSNLHQDAFWG